MLKVVPLWYRTAYRIYLILHPLPVPPYRYLQANIRHVLVSDFYMYGTGTYVTRFRYLFNFLSIGLEKKLKYT
jgi:hypothetical protein